MTTAFRFARRSLVMLSLLVGFAGVSGAQPPRAAAAEWGIRAVGVTETTSSAAEHPDLTTQISFELGGRVEDLSVSLPPGLFGNPNVALHCSTGHFVAAANCPFDSQVGMVRFRTRGSSGDGIVPLYNLDLPHPEKEVARLGFIALSFPVFIDVSIRTASDYGVTATVHGAPAQLELASVSATIWGVPADQSHDEQRITNREANVCHTGTACEGGARPSGLLPKPFLDNPSACEEQAVGFAASSYQIPGKTVTAAASLPPIIDCTGLPYAPSLKVTSMSRSAGTPTGLEVSLTIPHGEDPALPGTATTREARVMLPEGMAIAAGAAAGLGACSADEVGLHREVDSRCPANSKLGTATVISPNLPAPLHGALYQRTPEPGHLFRLWLVTDELGLHVKLPGEIEVNSDTGRLTAVFRDLPQVPVERIDLNVWGGSKAPLKNPDTCGTYATSYVLSPHSEDPAASGRSEMTIDNGCSGDGFSPQLRAGAATPVAGAFSPFIVDLTREDREQNLGSFAVTLPKGELAKLAGVSLCPDSVAPGGACPADSRIGSLTSLVGPGPDPLRLPQPGKPSSAIYLAGPYKGAPFSVVSVIPAQAGPFDLGVVSVRSALFVDPETARATISTGPLPQFLEGVPVIYRRVHTLIDRSGFALNPTNCSKLRVTSTLTSAKGALARPSDRFRVGRCGRLGFRPKLSLELDGGTKRGSFPALTASLEARKGDANIGKVSVTLPHSEFLAQEHIVTICTRKRFSLGKCPKGSVYGKAKAWTPLLDKPLEGPVYLRSSDNPLPDLVVALRGELEIDLVGRIDSKNQGIRTSFEAVPDAPVSKFVLKMKGGDKSLLVNSTGVCRGKHRAIIRIRGQNGRTLGINPLLESSGCRKSFSK